MMCSNALRDDVMRLRVARSWFSFSVPGFKSLRWPVDYEGYESFDLPNNLFQTVEKFLMPD